MKTTKGFLTLAFLAIVVMGTVLEYSHETYVTCTVLSVNTQQKTHGDKDGFRTTYEYLVATDCGTFEICPDGLMASKSFGTLQEGKKYRFRLKGYSVPFIGLYPYVMSAIKLED